MTEKKSRAESVLEGMNILAKYPNPQINVGHDQLWFGPEKNVELDPEDQARLELLGWFEDEDTWSHWV